MTAADPPGGSSEATAEGTLPKGTEIGRYVVVKVLGQGGMGVVYAAYDPQLDRRVALKLLRADVWDVRIDDGHTRLLREAQAMAKLSHPNVVSVFDVGTHHDQLYVAMDYVDGLTLRRWLSDAERSVDEIVSAFLEAARGLAAAHAVGLIHRDFKPENVLRGTLGRVCVADFGLARSVSERDVRLHDSNPRTLGRSSFGVHATESGVLLGTPAYMAPEQYAGGHADERTDQFSFCVALYEALYGEPPFGGGTITELVTEVSAGRVRPAPAGSRVPEHLRRAVLRGLETAPEARFPSMDALIDAIAPRPRAIPRRLLAAVGAGLLIVAGVAVYEARHPALLCSGSSRKLVGVWDEARRRAVHDSFLATHVAYAESAWRSVERAFDAYARAWVAARTDACEGTRVRGEQSERLLDLRMLCLDDELRYAGALSTLLARADPEVVEHAAASAASLPGIHCCADAKRLSARTPLPGDAGARAQIQALEAKLDEGKAMFEGGHRTEAAALAAVVVRDAEPLHYPPLLGDALALRGRIETASGDANAAATLKAALLSAEAANDDDQVAPLWIALVRAYTEQAKFDEAEDAREHAEAFLARLPDPTPARANLAYVTGILHAKSGKPQLAREDFGRALEIWEKHSGPESRDVSTALGALSTVGAMIGDNQAAIDNGRRALEIDRKILGDLHPDLVNSEGALAGAYANVGKTREAYEHYRRALEIAERSLPPDSPSLAEALGNWASTGLLDQKRYAEALSAYARVLKIEESHFGDASPVVAQTLSNIAVIEQRAGKLTDARAHLERAVAIEEKALGPGADELARTLRRLAGIYVFLRMNAEALLASQRAVAIFEKSVDVEQSLDFADALAALGQDYVSLRRYAEARPPLEHSLRIQLRQPQTEGTAEPLAETRFALALALWHTGERPRALSLAHQAREVLAKDDPFGVQPHVDDFLAQARER